MARATQWPAMEREAHSDGQSLAMARYERALRLGGRGAAHLGTLFAKPPRLERGEAHAAKVDRDGDIETNLVGLAHHGAAGAPAPSATPPVCSLTAARTRALRAWTASPLARRSDR